MQFKEYCQYRFVELFAGLFWVLALPVAFVILLLKSGAQTEAIIGYVFMVILWFAAIKLLAMGIEDALHNGKTAVILSDDGMDVLLHFTKHKSEMRHFAFDEICNFYFVANGTIKNKTTKTYEIKPNANGTLWFASKENKKMVYGVSVYNALPAVQWIVARLQEDQIDHESNEWTKDGRYTPKG